MWTDSDKTVIFTKENEEIDGKIHRYGCRFMQIEQYPSGESKASLLCFVEENSTDSRIQNAYVSF